MVSYTKARAQSIGLSCEIGLMERPERLIVLIAGATFHAHDPGHGRAGGAHQPHRAPAHLLHAPRHGRRGPRETMATVPAAPPEPARAMRPSASRARSPRALAGSWPAAGSEADAAAWYPDPEALTPGLAAAASCRWSRWGRIHRPAGALHDRRWRRTGPTGRGGREFGDARLDRACRSRTTRCSTAPTALAPGPDPAARRLGDPGVDAPPAAGPPAPPRSAARRRESERGGRSGRGGRLYRRFLDRYPDHADARRPASAWPRRSMAAGRSGRGGARLRASCGSPPAGHARGGGRAAAEGAGRPGASPRRLLTPRERAGAGGAAPGRRPERHRAIAESEALLAEGSALISGAAPSGSC